MSQTTSGSQVPGQLPMFGPDVVRVTCEVIVFPDRGSLTFHVRSEINEDGNLIAAWSRPLRASQGFLTDFGDTLREFRQQVEAATEPFPDVP